jgi:hypothetical protein
MSCDIPALFVPVPILNTTHFFYRLTKRLKCYMIHALPSHKSIDDLSLIDD